MSFENYFRGSEENQEDRNFINRLRVNFSLFDVDPEIPIIEKEESEGLAAKACFHFDEIEKDGVVEITNESYDIFLNNNKKIDPRYKEELLTKLPFHEIRHRIQRENQYERLKNREDLELFTPEIIDATKDGRIKDLIKEYVKSLPEEVKSDPWEFDAKLAEEIIYRLMENNLIGAKEIKTIIGGNASSLIKLLEK